MMYMDDEFLESNDLDWFSVFQDGCLAHFTTGGVGYVPEEMRESLENYEAIYDYFGTLCDISDFEIIECNVPIFTTDKQRERYLRSFTQMASKGVYSYDVNRNEGGYKLIAKPITALGKQTFPINVRGLLYSMSSEISSGALLLKF